MRNKSKKLIYIPTFGEEVANTVSHGVMAVLVLIALPFCAVWAYIHGTGKSRPRKCKRLGLYVVDIYDVAMLDALPRDVSRVEA